jgi:hypothetical protein
MGDVTNISRLSPEEDIIWRWSSFGNLIFSSQPNVLHCTYYNMKTSLAILLLIGAVKNVRLTGKNQVAEGGPPPDDILLGTKSRNVGDIPHEFDTDDLVSRTDYV